MKKIIVMGICTLLLTGCGGGKKLVCSQEETYDGDINKTEVTVNYDKKGEKPKSYTMKDTIVYKDTSELEEDYEYAVEYCKEYEKEYGAGYSCKANKNGNTLTHSISVDLSKLDAEDRKDLEEEIGKYEDTKKYLENMTYTCK